MSHTLVLALFADGPSAATAAQTLHALGVTRDDLSVVARSHAEEAALARQIDGTPGAEIEDSRPAGMIGELGGHILSALAAVTPGIGTLVADGPLSAALGESAGHAAGDVASVLRRAGVACARADKWHQRVADGAVLLGVHSRREDPMAIREALERNGAEDVELARWNDR